MNARILIVEDESIVQLHLSKMLKRLGHEVVGCAASGDEALELAARRPPELAMMDIRIHGDRDGIEVAEELRRKTGCSVVFLTAYADEPTLERARRLEPAGYLVKPFEESDVRAVLTTALAKEKAVRRIEEIGRDLSSILDELEVGTAMVDKDSTISFLSAPAARLLGLGDVDIAGAHWRLALPFEAEALDRLERLLEQPKELRRRLPVTVGGRSPRQLQIDVRDDPRGRAKRILFIYDATEVHDLRRLLQEKGDFHDLIGRSPAMLRVYEQIRQSAAVDWTVLIEGETGTGKELVAHAIHDAGPRREGPFVAVNCAGLSESLLASQLFGHKKGAFTGAVSDHRGYFEIASGGTLFLDEIGDVPMSVQNSFLRVLEDRRVTPLGAASSKKVDVRIVTATHRNLADEVTAGRFRADLLYRIRVARVSLPPLRERGDDILLLADWFLDRGRAAVGKPSMRFDPGASARLSHYAWPGNVRELKSAVEHGVIRSRDQLVTERDLPPELVPPETVAREPGDEKTRILVALQEADGNRSKAARLLGISRATFYRRLEQLGLVGS